MSKIEVLETNWMGTYIEILQKAHNDRAELKNKIERLKWEISQIENELRYLEGRVDGE